MYFVPCANYIDIVAVVLFCLFKSKILCNYDIYFDMHFYLADSAATQKKCPGENEFDCDPGNEGQTNRHNSTKQCIPESWVCDMIPDCTAATGQGPADEKDCLGEQDWCHPCQIASCFCLLDLSLVACVVF